MVRVTLEKRGVVLNEERGEGSGRRAYGASFAGAKTTFARRVVRDVAGVADDGTGGGGNEGGESDESGDNGFGVHGEIIR